MAPLWRESVGRKGFDLVTVYERVPGGPLHIEWWRGGKRVQKSLKSLTEVPVYDRALAVDIAREVSNELAKGATGQTARDVLGLTPTRTLGELLTEYHAKKSARWSEGHRSEQERMRDFWLATLGTTKKLPLSPAEVEAEVDRAAEAKKWSDRSRQKALVYIKSAVTFAEKKLKWIGPKDNLSAIDIPVPDQNNAELAYTTRQVDALLPALEQVDVRAGAVGEIAYITGRRQSAIRTLKRKAYEPAHEVEMEDGSTITAPVITFPALTDKARKRSRAVLSERAARLLSEIAERWPDSPHLIPSDDGKKSIPERELYRMLWDAEVKAKVPRVTGRAYHGLKRRGVTDSRKATGSMGGAQGQSGTTRQTLERVYEQQDLDEQVASVKAMEKRRGRK